MTKKCLACGYTINTKTCNDCGFKSENRSKFSKHMKSCEIRNVRIYQEIEDKIEAQKTEFQTRLEEHFSYEQIELIRELIVKQMY